MGCAKIRKIWVTSLQGENADHVEDGQYRRLVLAYKLGSLIVIAIGLTWGALFLSMRLWLLTGVEFGFAALGALNWLLIQKGKLAAAILFSQAAFLVFAVLFCLVCDVPSAAAPRVSHLFILVLAMLGYINYLRQPSLSQICLIAACLIGFVAFASAELSFPFAQPIGDDIRVVGSWINAVIATAMLCGCVYILRLEIAGKTKFARDIQRAVRAGEFELHYQPQVDCNARTIGAEALLRWNDPRRGMVSPAEFIPAAEQAGLMVQVGLWVLNEACKTLATWAGNATTANLTLAVNVSPTQFMDTNFEQSVLRTIEFHGVDPTRLQLELTESVMVADVDNVVRKMNLLKNAGVSFALDDFGTGYSSLGQLRNLPLAHLKMDRSFVLDIVTNQRSAMLARNIIQLGSDLELVVIAEGVETLEQFTLLLEGGCTQFQGFLFGRPAPLGAFELSLQQAPVL